MAEQEWSGCDEDDQGRLCRHGENPDDVIRDR